MKLRFNSVLSDCEKPVDSRYLTLAFEFYNTDGAELIRLAKHTLRWTLDFIRDDFITSWSDGKHTKSLQKMQKYLLLLICCCLNQ